MVLMIWHDFEKNVRYHENSQIAIRVSATIGFSNSPSSLTSILYDVECTWRVRNVRSEYKELPERCAGSRAEHTQGSHPACIITLNAMTTTLILLKSTQQATNIYANRMSKGSRQRLQSARYFYPLSWKPPVPSIIILLIAMELGVDLFYIDTRTKRYQFAHNNINVL